MNPTLTFVTGKGGVGKTRMSLLLAKTLPDSRLAELTPALEREARAHQIDFPEILHTDRKMLAADFLNQSTRLKPLLKLVSGSSTFQTLLGLAPNLYEILVLRRWMEWAKDRPLIVDAPSSGHFLGLIDAARATLELFDGGSLHKIAEEISNFFETEATQVCIVSIPEKSSLEESRNIEERIRKTYPKIQIVHILNRRHQTPSFPRELLDEPYRSLAFERPEREKARIEEFETKGTKFNRMIFEGARSL